MFLIALSCRFLCLMAGYEISHVGGEVPYHCFNKSVPVLICNFTLEGEVC